MKFQLIVAMLALTSSVFATHQSGAGSSHGQHSTALAADGSAPDAFSSASAGPEVEIKTSDGQILYISENAARISATFNEILESRLEGDDSAIPATNVNGKTMNFVVEYLNHHSSDAAPTPGSSTGVAVPGPSNAAPASTDAWDVDFIEKLERDDLFAVVSAANYLNIKPLLELGCIRIAKMITGKTVKEMSELLGVKNDLTPEEMEEVKREGKWAFGVQDEQ